MSCDTWGQLASNFSSWGEVKTTFETWGDIMPSNVS